MTEETLVEQALHLPKREARRWRHMKLDQEDLVADGYLGLARAARRYDTSLGVPFTAFAHHFVRGAIVDTVASRFVVTAWVTGSTRTSAASPTSRRGSTPARRRVRPPTRDRPRTTQWRAATGSGRSRACRTVSASR